MGANGVFSCFVSSCPLVAFTRAFLEGAYGLSVLCCTSVVDGVPKICMDSQDSNLSFHTLPPRCSEKMSNTFLAQAPSLSITTFRGRSVIEKWENLHPKCGIVRVVWNDVWAVIFHQLSSSQYLSVISLV